MQPTIKAPLFSLGQVVATPGALVAMESVVQPEATTPTASGGRTEMRSPCITRLPTALLK